MPNLGGWEWVILAVVALVLFGGTRIAGLGKGAGRAIREFKEETSSVRTELAPGGAHDDHTNTSGVESGAARPNPDNQANANEKGLVL
jgi:TatA/E family protein of Tat protein translocase